MIYIIIAILLLSSIVWASVSFAPWIPVRKQDLKRIYTLANLRPGETFIELGSGTGRVLFYIAKKINLKAIGIELGFPLFVFSKIKARLKKIDVKIKLKNFFNENLGSADVVYFFGMPNHITDKLKTKLDKELKPGTRVISYSFPVPGWKPMLIDKPSENDLSIYLYKKI